MQAFVVASLEEGKIDDVVQHCKAVEENLKKIFLPNDPDFSVKFWYSDDNIEDLVSLNIALVGVKNSAIVYFCKGWEKHKETSTLHYICEAYAIQRMEE